MSAVSCGCGVMGPLYEGETGGQPLCQSCRAATRLPVRVGSWIAPGTPVPCVAWVPKGFCGKTALSHAPGVGPVCSSCGPGFGGLTSLWGRSSLPANAAAMQQLNPVPDTRELKELREQSRYMAKNAVALLEQIEFDGDGPRGRCPSCRGQRGSSPPHLWNCNLRVTMAEARGLLSSTENES